MILANSRLFPAQLSLSLANCVPMAKPTLSWPTSLWLKIEVINVVVANTVAII